MADISKFVMELSKEIMEIVRAVMESNLLINNKTKPPRNTIAPDSEIYKNLQVKATNDGDLVYDILLNDYLTYIESGRRKGAKMPPVEPIIKWARQRGISTDNSTIFLIRRAISRDGIKPRPFMATVLDEIDLRWDGWSDDIFEEITKIITDYFNS